MKECHIMAIMLNCHTRQSLSPWGLRAPALPLRGIRPVAHSMHGSPIGGFYFLFHKLRYE